MADLSLARAQLQTALEDRTITPGFFTVGLALLGFARKRDPWPSLETLSHKAGVSVRTVSRAIDRLREIGWVSWRQRRCGWNRCLSNVYTILAAVVRTPPVDKPIEDIRKPLLDILSNGSPRPEQKRRPALLGGLFAPLERRIIAMLATQGHQIE